MTETTNNAVLIQNATLYDVERMIRRAVDERMSAVSVQQPKAEVEEKKGLPKLYRRIETAKMLQVTPTTLDDWARCGLIKSSKLGGRVYYSEDEIARALGNRQANK